MTSADGDENAVDLSDTATERAHETALACIHAGIDAADPERVVRDGVRVADGNRLAIRPGSRGQRTEPTQVDSPAETLDLDDFSRILVLGGGNAAGRAARALEVVLGDRLDGGLVVTDAPTDTSCVEQLPGDHPIPSERGVDSTQQVLDAAADADDDTLVFVVITGGGSALMPAPAPGIDLADLQSTTDALLRSGAPIEAVNAVRKHVSESKGGRLAQALAPARVVTIAFSDVVGNQLDAIASGPPVPDSTTYRDALDVLDRHGVDAPKAIRERLEAGVRGDYEETPKADHPAFDRTSVHVLADSLTTCAAAKAAATERGYDAMVLTTHVTGPAREAARWHTAVAAESRDSGNPLDPPAVVVTGGETTVRVTGDGVGGPNQEFALAAALDLPPGCAVAAVDTDGIDGNSTVAGALVTSETTSGVGDRGRDAATDALDANDSHRFLDAQDALIDTGVTGTNVNDLRVLVVETLEDA